MFGCTLCTRTEPTDTVKVNMASITSPASFDGADKENQPVQPANAPAAEQKKLELEAARRQQELEKEERQRREAEAAAERAAEEERRREALRQRLAEEAAEEARKKEEELRLQAELEEIERQHVLEEERKRQEAERQRRQEAEEQRLKAEEEAAEKARLLADREKMGVFLKEHGFSGGVNTKRTRFFSSKYPLHSAVKAKDAVMVGIMLREGADAALKNSAGQSALQLAQKSDKKGSHAAVIAVLNQHKQ